MSGKNLNSLKANAMKFDTEANKKKERIDLTGMTDDEILRLYKFSVKDSPSVTRIEKDKKGLLSKIIEYFRGAF